MSTIINIGKYPAVRVNGRILKKLDKSTLIDFEGTKLFVPNSLYRKNNESTVDVAEWYYNKNLA